MKYLNKILAALTISAGFLAVSCEDQPDAFVPAEGVPSVDFIRYADRDIVITQAFMQEAVCLVGNNLRSINQLWFNDQEAVLNTSYITDNTLVVSVPKTKATVRTDKIYMITAAKDTVTYDFVVLAPAPVVKAMSNEYAKEGEEVTITGQYFISPITIEFQGAVIEEADMKLSETAATFKIPAGTQPGVVKVTTASGTTKAPFQYRDPRGLITNFDGGTDVVPQGWNFKGEYKSEGGVDGNYVELKSAKVLDESGAWNEDYKIDFWCGNWNGDPMSVTSGPGTPICYVVDFTDFKNMALKFEICIPKSNPWSSGAMQLIFTNSKNAANDSWQNNTFVHSSASDPAGLDLCRGLWRPWEATGEFHTDDKWITVTVPFSEFIYNSDGTPGLVPLERPEDFASFVIWAWSGGVNGKECNPIFRIDNIRAVSVK
jgi:hypothetical protein